MSERGGGGGGGQGSPDRYMHLRLQALLIQKGSMCATSIVQEGLPTGRELQHSVQARYGGMLKSEVIGFVAAKGVVPPGVDAALLNYRAVLHRLQGVGNAAVQCSNWGQQWSQLSGGI